MNLRFKKNFKPLLCKPNPYYSLPLINSSLLYYGSFGMQSLHFGVSTFKQINTIRIKISRYLKRLNSLKFKIFIRIFFIYSVTQKPKLTRMGKGSGSIKQWIGVFKPGLIFVEVYSRCPLSILKKACVSVYKLLPIKFIFVAIKVAR